MSADAIPDRQTASKPLSPLPLTGNGPDLRHMMILFRRRLPVFALIVAICVLLALNITIVMPRTYEAEADVLINRNRSELVPDAKGSEQQDNAPLRTEEIDTETKVILSRGLAQRVIAGLKLDSDDGFVSQATAGGVVSRIGHWLGRPGPARPADLNRVLVDSLLARLSATRLDTAYAIRISYRDRDPRRAAAVANALAAGYAESAALAKHSENRKTLSALSERLEQLRQQAQADYQAVQAFRIRNDLLSDQATALAEQETSAYAQQLSQARSGAAVDRGRAMSAALAAEAAAASSPAVQALTVQRSAASAQVAELSSRFLENHPQLIAARKQLSDLDYRLAAEVARAKSGSTAGLASNATATTQQVGALQSSFDRSRGKLARANAALVGLDDLNRKAQASQALYENYLGRYKEVLAQTGIEKAEARVLSEATVPTAPVSPHVVLNLLLGAVVGVLLGTAAAIAAESGYEGLTTGDEVETRVGLRYLGGIPLLASIDLEGADPAATLADHPGSAYAEAIRGLLTAVCQGNRSRSHVIAVTSALSDEGKTTLAMSLARAAANGGQSVIVIDCDTVQRGLSARSGIASSAPGLREMMRDGVKLGEAMRKDALSEAMILPITGAFGDGERLLERGHFETLITALRDHFALIVLDTAPILPIAETREIVALADKVVISALWRKTPASALRAALRLLPIHAGGDIGVTLNRMDMRKQAKFGGGDAAYFYDHYKSYYTPAAKA